jgi:hypothetical protein
VLEGGFGWYGHGKSNSTRTIDRQDSSHGEVAAETHKEQTGARGMCGVLFRLVTDHLPWGNPAQICFDEMLHPSREVYIEPRNALA